MPAVVTRTGIIFRRYVIPIGGKLRVGAEIVLPVGGSGYSALYPDPWKVWGRECVSAAAGATPPMTSAATTARSHRWRRALQTEGSSPTPAPHPEELARR